ncbi:MAG: DUF6320 domain-containing protein [Eubacteriales bacterium]|nr:DUF6320 domain-containing protein [Eubacteriales bacterium]
MKVNITYPKQTKKKLFLAAFSSIARWIMLAVAYACVITNICIGGKAWSAVALWALWFIWSFVFAPNMVEFNRISQTTKLMVYTCVQLILINNILSPGWAMFVIPIICFAGVFINGVFFLSNIKKQKQNLMPMIWAIAISLIAVIAAFAGWFDMNWPIIALGSTGFALLVVSVIVLGKGIIIEFVKRFSVK